MSKEPKTLGERIKHYREKEGWSQSRLAREARVPGPILSYIENDRLSLEVVSSVAEALNVTTDDLLPGTNVIAPRSELTNEDVKEIFYAEIQRIFELYDEQVLRSEIGTGNLRDKLLQGLERVIEKVEKMPFKYTPILDRKIDYAALSKISREWGYNVSTRLEGHLKMEGMRTYRDLVERVSQKGYTWEQGRRTLWIRNIGMTSERVLYMHLNSLGIKLFGDDYTPEELSEPNPYSSQSLSDLNLSVRTGNCLLAEGIKTVGQLILMTEKDLLRTKHFGRTSLYELRNVLGEIGLKLKE